MARELADLERLNPQPEEKFAHEVVTAMRVTLARIEGKLDSILGLRKEFDTHKDEVADQMEDIRTRLTKTEAWQGFALWIAGGIWAASLVVLTAVLAYVIHR